MAYDTRPHDWSIRSNSEVKNSVRGKKCHEKFKNFRKFLKKTFIFSKKLSFKCLLLCKSNQLVVSTTINYYKRIDGEGERVFELTDIRFIYSIYIVNPQNEG